MNYLHLLLILVALLNLVLGACVIIQRPQSTLHRSFFCITTGIFFFVSGIALLSATGVFIFDKFIHYGAITAVLGFLLFAIIFPNRPHVGVWWLLTLPLFITAGAIVPFGHIVEDVAIGPGGELTPTHGAFIVPYALGLLTYVGVSLVLLIQRLRKSRGRTRLQLQYVLSSIGTFMLFVVVSNALLPAFGVTTFIFLGPLASLFVTIGTAYAIVRHELMDIRIVLQRGLIFTALLSLTIGCYLGLVTVLNALSHQLIDATLLSGMLTTVIGVFTVPIFERYFRKVTDRFFFRDRYEYADVLHELSGVLSRSINLTEILRETEQSLERILKATATIQLSTERMPEITERTPQLETISLPIKTETGVIGTLTLGPKYSEEVYTTTDLTLLKTLTHQLAIALHRARLHEAVEAYSRELEDKVAARTQALKRAEESQRQLIVDIAHSLLTPLTIVKNELSSLTTERTRDNRLQTFTKSIDDLGVFVYDMLRLARIERGAEKEEWEEFNLSKLLHDLVNYLRVPAEDQNVTITHTIKDNLSISGAPKKIEEALLNLLGNALKYMDTTRACRVHLALLQYTDETCEISISDTGMGIRDTEISRVFERFYRTKESKAVTDGSGLGLAITRAIIEQHRGSISLESTYGVGTTFTIRLPLARSL